MAHGQHYLPKIGEGSDMTYENHMSWQILVSHLSSGTAIAGNAQ